ncbi:MAG: hypothetical protein IPK77_04460 [Cellvibrio sp.]|nr:hypothetical protein [Cellvibrio sp.]
MNAHSLKQDALESFQRLPDDVDVDEMMYQLYVIDKLHKSREAIKQGDVISHDDLKQEMKQW